MLHRFVRRLVLFGLLPAALLLTVPAPVIAGPVAVSSVGCGAQCNGQNPNTYVWWDANEVPHRCRDSAVTLYTYTGPPPYYRSVDLRYSTVCKAAWARAGNAIHFKVQNSKGLIYEVAFTPSYTPMVERHSGITAKACVFVDYLGFYCGPSV